MDEVTLYRAPTTVADADELAAYLDDCTDATVSVRGRFTADTDDQLTEDFAEARVLSPYDRETGNIITGIVRDEQRALDSPEQSGGVIYGGLAVQRLLGERVPEGQRDLDYLHVVLTSRVLGTWDDHDGRWHKRVNVLGQPALVSVPGLYEAPAKPDSYYEAKQKHALVSGSTPPRKVLES